MRGGIKPDVTFKAGKLVEKIAQPPNGIHPVWPEPLGALQPVKQVMREETVAVQVPVIDDRPAGDVSKETLLHPVEQGKPVKKDKAPRNKKQDGEKDPSFSYHV
jgi:hypothetical protein